MAIHNYVDAFDFSLDDVLRLPPPVFSRSIGYGERICLERWVSGCEPTLVYGRNHRFRGLALAGGDGSLVVHAPPTDKWFLDSNTGYPPDWDFYNRGAQGEQQP